MKLTKTRLKQIIREEIQNLRKPLSEGLNMDTSSIKKIENVFQKELNIDDVKLEKKESRARAAYTFRVAGKKHGLYIDVAYDWSDLEERIDYVLSNFNIINEKINTNVRERFMDGYDYNKLCLYWYNIFKDLSGVEANS